SKSGISGFDWKSLEIHGVDSVGIHSGTKKATTPEGKLSLYLTRGGKPLPGKVRLWVPPLATCIYDGSWILGLVPYHQASPPCRPSGRAKPGLRLIGKPIGEVSRPLPGKVRHFHVQGMADLALYDRHVRGGRGPGRGSGALAVKGLVELTLLSDLEMSFFRRGSRTLVVEKGWEGSGQDPALHLFRQRNNLSFGFGNVIRSSIHSDHGAKLPIPADHIIHHQAGGREKCSRFNLFFSRPPTLRRQQQQQQERINKWRQAASRKGTEFPRPRSGGSGLYDRDVRAPYLGPWGPLPAGGLVLQDPTTFRSEPWSDLSR
ncbi:hypothetical protein THAOC_28924, partial [Thalassiosira oceanica]